MPRLLDALQWKHGKEAPDNEVQENGSGAFSTSTRPNPPIDEVFKRLDRILDGSSPYHPEHVNTRRELYTLLAQMSDRLQSRTTTLQGARSTKDWEQRSQIGP